MRQTHTAMPFLFALLALLLALPNQNLLAQTTHPFAAVDGTNGTAEYPYQITTIAHLNAIRGNFLDDHFVLTKDLDFLDTDERGADYVYSTASGTENAKGWLPIGHDTMHGRGRESRGFQGTPFSGSFDGDGHVILNLLISRSGEDFVGLFGVAGTGGVVKNLGLENLNVSGGSPTGGLVGRTSSETTISSCYTAGDVSGADAGGLAGENYGLITLCYSSARVTSSAGSSGGLMGIASGIVSSSYSVGDVTGTGQVGGFVGSAQSASIRSCYSTGSATGTSLKVGGFIGHNSTSTLTSCYSTGNAAGAGFVGGFLGDSLEGSATSCYSTGTATATSGNKEGGFVGNDVDLIRANTYWENTGTAIGDAMDNTDRTPTQMKGLTTFGSNDAHWDFGTDTQYPALKHDGSLICGQSSPRAYCEPPVQIASATAVTEGTDAEFTLTRWATAADLAATLTVTVSVTGGAGFIGTPLPNVTFATDSPTATYSVPTEGDTMDEADGRITVTITDTTTDYSVEQGQGSATAEVMDDDLPLVSIAGGDSVVEGDGAVFTVTREGVTTEALAVKVTVGGDAGFLPSAVSVEVGGREVSPIVASGDSFMIMIAAGATEVDLTAASEGDGLDEADGMIEATVTAVDGSYRVDTADPPVATTVSASVDVTDNDLPLVSIAGGDSVIEGDGAVFTVTRVGDTTEALSVKVTVGGGAGFLPSAVSVEVGGREVSPIVTSGDSFMIMIAAGATEVVFTAGTEGDAVDEADGMIEATVTAVDGSYRVDAADPPVATTVSASVDVTDNDLPLVSIAGGDSVIEGDGAVFTVTRVGDTTEALSVKVTVGGGAGFLPSAVSVEVGGREVSPIVASGDSFMIMIAAGATEVVLTAASEGDGLDEADGMIEATVTAVDGSYRVDAADTPVATTVSASVDVTDNDLPSITSFEIGGNSGRIDENADPKTITVTVAERTSLADLDPTVVTVRSDATVAPAGAVTFEDGMAQDYTVTAGGDTVTYQVTVNVVVGTPPGVPRGFLVVAGVEQVTLSWTAPTELGSTGTLSKYEYRQTQGAAVSSPWTVVEPPKALTQVVGSLTADVVYGFEVRAVGSNGLAGDATAKQEATPLAVGSPMFSVPEEGLDQTYTENTEITPLTLPVATGGMGTLTYALTPVPAGLEFDAGTRILSGTPTMPTTTTHTYKVTDSTPVTALTAILTFMITVNAAGTFGIGSQGAAVHVYPNPAGDVLHIEFPGADEYGITLLTLTGQLVLGERHAGGGAQILDLSSLTKGVYVLKIEDSEGVSHTFRIIR